MEREGGKKEEKERNSVSILRYREGGEGWGEGRYVNAVPIKGLKDVWVHPNMVQSFPIPDAPQIKTLGRDHQDLSLGTHA